jgi:hypothetical protein
MNVATIEMLPEGSDAAVRVYRCNRCHREMRLTASPRPIPEPPPAMKIVLPAARDVPEVMIKKGSDRRKRISSLAAVRRPGSSSKIDVRQRQPVLVLDDEQV